MKAKEKATEIVNRFYIELHEHKGHYDLETARQCALIVVDELIKECTLYRPSPEPRFDYLQQVKVEILNL